MSNPGMWLEIRRGKTNFPLRPISGDRFLIGAGSHCHLQLGGDHFPMLHSLLVIEGQTAHLEAVVSEPPLMVNGEARRSVELHDGDAVVIGDFEFVFHRLVAIEPAGQVAVASPSGEVENCEVTDLNELSAVELVDLIEEEARQIAMFNRSREQGAASLLDAARRSGAATPPVSVSMATFRQDTPTEEEHAFEVMTEQGRYQFQRVTERESECQRRASELMAAQEQLAAQMDEFAKQVARWQEADRRRSLRASA